jgi:hypothetical protein
MSKYITKFDLGMLAKSGDSQNLKICVGFNNEAITPALETLKSEIREFADAHPELSGLDVYEHFQSQILEVFSANTILTTNNSY